MIKTSCFAVMFVIAGSAAAHAGGQAGSIGIGAEYQLSGIEGLSLNYDAGQFHVGGMLGYYDPAGGGNSVFEIGGRFYYHVHRTSMADFSLGGNIGLASVPGAMDDRKADVYLEPGFQIRFFVVPNVAISFTGGIVIGLVDASDPTSSPLASGVEITGQVSAAAGIHYYFF
jgi:hypothetical protein